MGLTSYKAMQLSIAMEIYNLIIKLVSSPLSTNIPIFTQSLFLQVVAVFELKYFDQSLQFFYINLNLDSLYCVDMFILC